MGDLDEGGIDKSEQDDEADARRVLVAVSAAGEDGTPGAALTTLGINDPARRRRVWHAAQALLAQGWRPPKKAVAIPGDVHLVVGGIVPPEAVNALVEALVVSATLFLWPDYHRITDTLVAAKAIASARGGALRIVLSEGEDGAAFETWMEERGFVVIRCHADETGVTVLPLAWSDG